MRTLRGHGLRRSRSHKYALILTLSACLHLVTPNAHAQGVTDSLAKAKALVRAGRYDGAIGELQRAHRAHPSDPRILAVEGVAYAMKGDDAQALRAVRAALRIDPTFTPALQTEAQILTREHSPEAKPVLVKLLNANPSDSIAREMLALEQARSGECAPAVSNFQAIAASMTAHPESLLSYAGCLYSEDKFSAALPVFSQLLALQPSDAHVRYDLVLTQVRAGDNKGAIQTAAPLLDENPDVDTLTLASEASEASGNTAQAVELLRRAIVQDPTLSDSYVRFAELCMSHESYEAGIAMVSAGISRLPQNSSLYIARGMLYGGKGDYEKAEADFRAAEMFDPKHGTGSYGVGLVEAQNHHPEQALKTTRAALREHPDDAQLNYLLARILIEDGERPGSPGFKEARSAAETAVRLRPDLLSARDLLAKIYALAGDVPQSIEQSKAALAIDPSDQTALYRLMLSSKQMGDNATVHELAKRLADELRHAREAESNRLRYRLVEATGPQQAGGTTANSPAHP